MTKLNFGVPGCCEDYDDKADEIPESNTIHTTNQQRRAATALERFDVGTSDVNLSKGDSGDNADADEKGEALQADE